MKHLRVLDNTQADQSVLCVLDISKGAVLVQLVSTELAEFLPPSAHLSGEEDVQLVFLHLVQDAASAHVLSGCIAVLAEDAAPSSSCQATFVLDHPGGAPAPRLHVFPGFPAVTDYSQIQMRISSATASFAADDAIIAAVGLGAEVTVSAVMLASESLVSASLALPGTSLASVTPAALASDTASQLAVLTCSSSSECAAHVMELQGGVVQLSELVTCSGSSALLSLERVGSSSGVASAVTCLALSASAFASSSAETCPSTGSGEVQLVAQHATSEESAPRITKASFVYTPALAVDASAASCSMARLRNAFVHRYKAAASGKARLKVLALSSAGALHMFQRRENEAESEALQWSREEALARVVDSLILDGVSSDPVGHERVESLGGRMPSLETRLRMQFFDLQEVLLGWVAQLQLPELGLDALKKGGGGGGGADRPTLEAFGFNKVAVMLTSVCDVHTSSFSSVGQQQQGQQQCLEGLKVYGLDLITGDVLWAFQPEVARFLPTPSSAVLAPFNIFGRLLKVRPHLHGSLSPEISLVLSVEERAPGGQSALLTYSFNPHTGEVSHTGGKKVCDASSPHRLPSTVGMNLGQVTSIQLYNGDARGQEETNSYLLVHRADAPSADTVTITPPRVSIFPSVDVINQQQREVYTQVCAGISSEEAQCSSLVSFRVIFQHPWSGPGSDTALYPTEVVGSVVFNKQVGGSGQVVGESVVAVQYPTPGDPVHSRARVLGDNSLLIKYLNPHLVAVVTEKLHRDHDQGAHTSADPAGAVAAAAVSGLADQAGISLGGEDDAAPAEVSSSGSAEGQAEEEQVDELFVNVIDTVSAQIVHRYSILHASSRLSGKSSVQVSWIENNLLVSYWSTQAQRQELSSVSLFEGMIDKYGLGPFSSVKVDHARSSFNAPPPIALQKTFILPRKVTALHHTVTSRGITNKNLLLGLGSGQVYSLDLRMLDPRRPVNKPTPAEMEEKLMQYVPFIALHPFQMLSTNSSLPPVQRVLSAPSKLESTSVVVTLGLDVYHTRTVPSKGFDMLASDFNKPLLSLILFSMGAAVVWLRSAYKKQLISSGWK